MIETLFKTIPRGINEAYVIGTLLFFAAWLFRRKIHNRKFFVYTLLFIVMVIAVRCYMEIISSRYCAILIYPAVIITAYFTLNIGRILKEQRIPVKVCRWLPRLFIVLLCCIAVLKLFKQNQAYDQFETYNKVLRATANELKEQGAAVEILTNGHDSRRLKYYGNTDAKFITDKKTLKDYLNEMKTIGKTVIVDIQDKPETPYFSEEELKSAPFNNLKLYTPVPTEKGRRRHFIYTFTAPEISVRELNASEIQESPGNILQNAGMEKTLPLEEGKKQLPNMTVNENKITQVPTNSYFSTQPTNKEWNIQILEADAIAGKHSLLMKSGDAWIRLTITPRIRPGKYRYSVLVRGTPQTEVRLVYDVYGKNDGGYCSRSVIRYTLPAKRLYQLEGVIDCPDENIDYLYVGASIKNGEAVFDNFTVEPFAR